MLQNVDSLLDEGDPGHWEARAWETCDIEVWGTTADLGFPVTKDKDIVQSARDAAEGRQTNLMITPEILTTSDRYWSKRLRRRIQVSASGF